MFGVEFNRNQKLALYVLLGLCIIGVAYSHILNSRAALGEEEVVLRENRTADGVEIEAIDSDPPPTVSELRSAGKVICHVVGCVKKPGVYSLQRGQRVIDAINAAGGPKPDADLEAINLAAKVEDGSRIELPSFRTTRHEAGTASLMGTSNPKRHLSSEGTSDKLTTPGAGVVHINTADSEELQTLPGVGPVTAERIIEYRRNHGPFSRPEQIMDVKGIGPKKYERMRPFVAL